VWWKRTAHFSNWVSFTALWVEMKDLRSWWRCLKSARMDNWASCIQGLSYCLRCWRRRLKVLSWALGHDSRC
jgi:hypothetical protein